MTMRWWWRKVVIVIVLSVTSAWSQQNDQESAAPSPPTMTPDTRPLSGVETIGLGSLGAERSYLQPGFTVSESGDTNALLQTGSEPGLQAVTVLAGHVSLNLLGRRNQLSLAYEGGGILYDTTSSLDTSFQTGGLSYSAQFRKASFLLTDRFSYLPGSYFGLGAAAYGGAFSLSSLGLPALQQPFLPAQGVLTGGAGYANAAAAQIVYEPGPRSAITAVGGFQYLYYSQAGSVGANGLTGQIGYDRSLSAKDTVAVFYSGSRYHFIGTQQNNNSLLVAFSYGRRVTGRMAWHIFAGPEVFTTTVPGRAETNSAASVGANLTYRWSKTQAGIYFYRGVTAGAGVLAGAETDALTGSLDRQLGRRWSGILTSGYYHNKGLPPLHPGTQNQSFGYWNGVVTLSRALGRYARFSMYYVYQTQVQRFNQPSIPGQGSETTVLRSIFGVTLNVTSRPLRI